MRDLALRARRKNGNGILYGACAKSCEKKKQRERGVDDATAEERVTSIGLAGDDYLARCKGTPPPPAPLPHDFDLLVLKGVDARAVLFKYHGAACGGQIFIDKITSGLASRRTVENDPVVIDGRTLAMRADWKQPQQKLAEDNAPTGSQRSCNMVIAAKQGAEYIGVLAMNVKADNGQCNVQAVHVMPRVRGPAQLGVHLWERAKVEVATVAQAVRNPRPKVKFTAEAPCCQSRQSASFWKRCGWTGTPDAQMAVRAYHNNEQYDASKPGQYVMGYVLQIPTNRRERTSG